jgi:hypothetical protein
MVTGIGGRAKTGAMAEISGDLVPVKGGVSIRALPAWSFWARPDVIGSSQDEIDAMHRNKVCSGRIAEIEAARDAARNTLLNMITQGLPS